MEAAIQRRDRASLLSLLEGSVETKKSSSTFHAFLDAGGLKALNGWLADGVSQIFPCWICFTIVVR